MKTILKHLKLLWRAFKEGEAGLHNRLHRERMQKKREEKARYYEKI
jgi:hypothetical protein